MRTSVLAACLGGLALAVIIAWCGVSHEARRPQEMATSTAKPVASTDSYSNQPKLAPDGFRKGNLMQQLRAGLYSDYPGDQARAFTNQLLKLIRVDPWAVARLAAANENASWHAEVMRILAQNWAAQNLAEAQQWVSNIDDANEQDTALGSICFQVAQTDPSRAIQTLEQQGLDDDRRKTMLGNLAQQWAAQDLPAAVNWAGNYPSGELRDSLFRQLAMAAVQTSPAEAGQLVVANISPGPAQQAAALAVLQEWAKQDLSGAMAWAEQFPPGEAADQAKAELAGVAAFQASGPVGLQ